MRARRDIEKGEEITLSYIDITQPVEWRRAELVSCTNRSDDVTFLKGRQRQGKATRWMEVKVVVVVVVVVVVSLVVSHRPPYETAIS